MSGSASMSYDISPSPTSYFNCRNCNFQDFLTTNNTCCIDLTVRASISAAIAVLLLTTLAQMVALFACGLCKRKGTPKQNESSPQLSKADSRDQLLLDELPTNSKEAPASPTLHPSLDNSQMSTMLNTDAMYDVINGDYVPSAPTDLLSATSGPPNATSGPPSATSGPSNATSGPPSATSRPSAQQSYVNVSHVGPSQFTPVFTPGVGEGTSEADVEQYATVDVSKKKSKQLQAEEEAPPIPKQSPTVAYYDDVSIAQPAVEQQEYSKLRHPGQHTSGEPQQADKDYYDTVINIMNTPKSSDNGHSGPAAAPITGLAAEYTPGEGHSSEMEAQYDTVNC